MEKFFLQQFAETKRAQRAIIIRKEYLNVFIHQFLHHLKLCLPTISTMDFRNYHIREFLFNFLSYNTNRFEVEVIDSRI